MASVVSGSLEFHEFRKKTSMLLVGSRNKSTQHDSINIVTILEKCNKGYPGLLEFYGNLSECAHPNYEGICVGYTKPDPEALVEHFANHWIEMYAAQHLEGIRMCMTIFEHEYNDVWEPTFRELEAWIEAHDAMLESTKGAPLP